MSSTLPIGDSLELLDHIPQLISAIADYVTAPEAEEIGANTTVMTKAAELGAAT